MVSSDFIRVQIGITDFPSYLTILQIVLERRINYISRSKNNDQRHQTVATKGRLMLSAWANMFPTVTAYQIALDPFNSITVPTKTAWNPNHTGSSPGRSRPAGPHCPAPPLNFYRTEKRRPIGIRCSPNRGRKQNPNRRYHLCAVGPVLASQRKEATRYPNWLRVPTLQRAARGRMSHASRRPTL
jgi:hypothetical protein